jgi:hypothetical protein
MLDGSRSHSTSEGICTGRSGDGHPPPAWGQVALKSVHCVCWYGCVVAISVAEREGCGKHIS